MSARRIQALHHRIGSRFLGSRRNALRLLSHSHLSAWKIERKISGAHLAAITATAPRGGGLRDIYFVARTLGSKPLKVTQGVVDRKHWVTLKKTLAADGFVITYWNALSDEIRDDVAA